jgi:NTP pyrophosphatase (non-canonical NTP hydrolase)
MTDEKVLLNQILDWADDRGLISVLSPNPQMLKVVEEVGELSSAILKNDREKTIDAIGDTLVTVIILSAQLGLNPFDCLKSAYNEIKDRKGKTINGTFIKEEQQ